jgi:dipeptidyl aminopeptidase/acylaminoacyl peptidase
MKVARAFGSWPSPLSAELVARASGRFFAGVWPQHDRLRWLEYRSDEGGRGVVATSGFGSRAGRQAEPQDITPVRFNVRTRVHEYGGAACWFRGETLFFSHFGDSRLYRQDGAGADPQPLTPEPPAPHALRYADGCVTADGANVICVRERHAADGVHNELVALAAGAPSEPRIVAAGSDFVASPTLDPNGRTLAWLRWDHPRMPWDGTELWVGELAADAMIAAPRRVAGGPEEAIFQPEWSPSGELHFCSDRSGWWNLYRLEPDGTVTALTHLGDAEVGYPAWQLGMRRYAFLDDGTVACIVTRAAVDSLELLAPGAEALEPVELEWTAYGASALGAAGGRLAFAARSPRTPATLVVLDPASGRTEFSRRSLGVDVDPASVSRPQAIDFQTDDGDIAHAFYYPPTSAESDGPPGARPPLRVICHGGPTAHSGPQLDFTVQYFTQRGIGVVDVNYRGSSGFGRAYRRRLDGRWGEIDWRDCVAAAHHLVQEGQADSDHIWIEGGSAGGYVVLCTLAFEPTAFAAGVSLFGVADAETLARDTHKFESRYLDTLIAPYPAGAELYRDRSPIHFVDRIERPLLLLQGLEDEVVPPNQSESIVAALQRKQVPHAYVVFPDEGHGFRKAENIRRSLEAELYFIGRLFGFEPADRIKPFEIHFAPPPTPAETVPPGTADDDSY